MRHLVSMIGLVVLLALTWGCEADQPAPADEPPASVQKARKRMLEQRKAEVLERTRRQKAVDEAWAERKKHKPSRDIERALLWRVDGPNGPLFLFGTVHVGVDASDVEELPPEARSALEQSDVTVLEVDERKIADRHVRDMMMQPAGQKLSDAIGEERVARLSELIAQPPRTVERMRPWVAESALVSSFAPDERAVDYWLRIHAQVLDHEIAYLETVDEQLDALVRSSTAESLAAVVDQPEEARSATEALLAAYKAGDAEAIAKVAFAPETLELAPQMYGAMFVERNARWVPKIESYLERGDVFVAVGAGHLVGDDSVVRMLEKRGHTVTRVPPAEHGP